MARIIVCFRREAETSRIPHPAGEQPVPFENAIRQDLILQGPEAILSNYIFQTYAGGRHSTARGKTGAVAANPVTGAGQLSSITGQLGAKGLDARRAALPAGSAAAGRAAIDAAAALPSVFAYFERGAGVGGHRIFCDTIKVYLDNVNAVAGVGGLAAYVLPSQGRVGVGGQIPPHVPGNPEFLFTTTIDGCTVKVAGDPQSPWVSHTNTSGENGKQALFAQRLADLDLAYQGFGANPVHLGQNATEFAAVPSHAGPGGASTYTARTQAVVTHQQTNWGETTYDRDKTIGYSKSRWEVDAGLLQELQQSQWVPSTSAVIGRRNSGTGNWEFFYQIGGAMVLHKYTKRKVLHRTISNSDRTLRGETVYASGKLWPPARTENPFPAW